MFLSLSFYSSVQRQLRERTFSTLTGRPQKVTLFGSCTTTGTSDIRGNPAVLPSPILLNLATIVSYPNSYPVLPIRYIAVSGRSKRQLIDIGPYKDVESKSRKGNKLKSRARSCVTYLDSAFARLPTCVCVIGSYSIMTEREKDMVFTEVLQAIEELLVGVVKTKPKSLSRLSYSSFYEHYLCKLLKTPLPQAVALVSS